MFRFFNRHRIDNRQNNRIQKILILIGVLLPYTDMHEHRVVVLNQKSEHFCAGIIDARLNILVISDIHHTTICTALIGRIRIGKYTMPIGSGRLLFEFLK